MRAVKPGQLRRGNPGASLYRCRTVLAGAANGAAGASTLCERRACVGRADCSGSARRPPAAVRGDSCWSTLGCNTADRGRNGSTAAPGRGTARTGTGGLNDPCPPRASSQRVLDGLVPGCNTAAAPPSSARCRARRGTKLAASVTAAVPTYFGIVGVVPPALAHVTGRAAVAAQRAGISLASNPLQRDRLRLHGRPRAAMQANLMRARSASAGQGRWQHHQTQNRVLAVE